MRPIPAFRAAGFTASERSKAALPFASSPTHPVTTCPSLSKLKKAMSSSQICRMREGRFSLANLLLHRFLRCALNQLPWCWFPFFLAVNRWLRVGGDSSPSTSQSAQQLARTRYGASPVGRVLQQRMLMSRDCRSRRYCMLRFLGK